MKKFTRALVVANEKKPIARQIKKEVQKFLSARGISISSSSPQLIITVGGDGTVLFSKKHYGIPFFSIGSQTSFVCQANFSDWKKKLFTALHSGSIEERLLLEATLNGKNLPLSLNEVGIRNPEPRILSMHLQAGSKHFAFRADGVFFSTPTGSPAYCYSCGGKEMKRTDKRYQIVAIAPFRRLFRPTVVPASFSCTLRISAPDKAHLFIDGQPAGTFSEKQTLKIRASKKKFLFVKI